jgi:hypothetical protein
VPRALGATLSPRHGERVRLQECRRVPRVLSGEAWHVPVARRRSHRTRRAGVECGGEETTEAAAQAWIGAARRLRRAPQVVDPSRKWDEAQLNETSPEHATSENARIGRRTPM